MKNAGKSISKLSGIMAEHEAHRTLTTLRNSSISPEETGVALCEKFTAAVRREILLHIAESLASGKEPPQGEALRRFLATQWQGLLAGNATTHAVAVLRVAAASNPRIGPGVAVEILLALLRAESGPGPQDGPPCLDSEALVTLAVSCKELGAMLAPVLEAAIARKAASPAFLRRWQRLILPNVGTRAGERILRAEDAAAILRTLGAFEVSGVPDDVVLICPRLLALAPVPDGGAFLGTPLGVTVSRLHPATQREGRNAPGGRSHPMQGPGPGPERPEGPARSPEEELAAAMEGVFKAHREAMAELKSQLAAKSASLGQALSELRDCRTELEKARQQYAKDVDPLRDEASRLAGELETARSSLTKAEEGLAKWQREASLVGHEASTRLKVESDAQLERLSTLLSRPTRNLRDHIEQFMKSHSGERDALHVAVAFDALHQKLLRLMNEPAEDRLPRELLPGA